MYRRQVAGFAWEALSRSSFCRWGASRFSFSLSVSSKLPRSFTRLFLAVPQAERQYCLDHIVATGEFGKVTKIVPGGAQRQDSVRHALAEVSEDTEIVLVHDAVRPFLTEDMIQKVVDGCGSTWGGYHRTADA